MELHQLRYFLAVVDHGGFTAAAHAVRISQSGVSAQIQKLERELGVVLIDRSGRRVTLTPAGQRLAPRVREAIAAVEDIAGLANDIRGAVVGSLRVATVTGLTWPVLFDTLQAIQREHPGIDLRLHEGNSDQLVDQVRDGALDLAVAAWSGAKPTGVRTATVVDDPLVAVVVDGHPWQSRAKVTAADLAAADLVALPPGTGARTALDDLFSRTGLPRLQPRCEVSSPSAVQMLVSRDIGVGVVSATTAEGWEDVSAVPISDGEARSQLGLLWHERPSHAARVLLRSLAPRIVTAA